MLRIIEGSVRDAVQAHGGVVIPEYMPRSIAKRAVGTLSSQWGDVLAAGANSPSERGAPQGDNGASRPRLSGPAGGRLTSVGGRPRRVVSQSRRHHSLAKLIRDISMQLRDLKQAGEHERVAAFIDVLRMIDKIRGEAR